MPQVLFGASTIILFGLNDSLNSSGGVHSLVVVLHVMIMIF